MSFGLSIFKLPVVKLVSEEHQSFSTKNNPWHVNESTTFRKER